MASNRIDERGRITIDPRFRKVLGARVVQILTPHGVLIRPVPDRLPDRGRLPSALKFSGDADAAAEAD